MAGIWELVSHANDETSNMPNHLLDAALVLVGAGHFTGAQAIAALESVIGRSFDAAELADLTALSALVSTGSTQARLVVMEEIKAAAIAAEAGVITETQYRAVLGL